MLTALYCRRLALPALSYLPCPPCLVLPALCSRSCAHGLVLTSCAHGLGSWSYSPDLILPPLSLGLALASRRLGSHAAFGLTWSHVL